MADVMVVYGPPITHLPPPAVGASPDAAIHDFKGSCRRSVRITVGRSLPWWQGLSRPPLLAIPLSKVRVIAKDTLDYTFSKIHFITFHRCIFEVYLRGP